MVISARAARSRKVIPDDHRATFIHGVFDEAPIVFTELANAPDWLPLTVYLNGERFSLDTGTLNPFNGLSTCAPDC